MKSQFFMPSFVVSDRLLGTVVVDVGKRIIVISHQHNHSWVKPSNTNESSEKALLSDNFAREPSFRRDPAVLVASITHVRVKFSLVFG